MANIGIFHSLDDGHRMILQVLNVFIIDCMHSATVACLCSFTKHTYRSTNRILIGAYSYLFDSGQAVTIQTDPEEVPSIMAWEVEAALGKNEKWERSG